MGVAIPPGYGQANLIIRHSGYEREAEVTFGFQWDATEEVDPTVIANDIMGGVTALLPSLDSSASFQRVETRCQGVLPDPVIGISSVAARPGTRAGESPPPAVAVLARKITGVGGRHNTGRMYWPWFLNEANVGEDGIIVAANVATIASQLDSFRGAMLTVPGIVSMVVLHSDVSYVTTRPSPGVKVVTRVPAIERTPTNILALVPEPTVATQRRRQTR